MNKNEISMNKKAQQRKKNDEEKEFDIRKESENVIKEELNKDVSLIGLRFVFVPIAHQDQRM